jgi:hypothetical protein
MEGSAPNALLSSSDCVRFRIVLVFGSMSESTSFGTLGAGGSTGLAASAAAGAFAGRRDAFPGRPLFAASPFFALVLGVVLVGIKI